MVTERNEASSNSLNVEKNPDLGRINPTTHLRKAKRRMEDCFIDDYCAKIKTFKREERMDYVGEYTFIVRVCVDDNTVEIKDTVTMCKITELEVEEKKQSDDSYNPESDVCSAHTWFLQ